MYRGLSLTLNEVEAYEQASKDRRAEYNTINLTGFNSISQDREAALGYALKNKDAQRESVLMEVFLSEGMRSGYCFVMNEDCYT